MALHVIHDDDGRITQAGINYTDPDKYSRMLSDMGQQFVRVRTQRLVSPDEWYVREVGSARQVRFRPRMPIEVSKTVIKAGENDAAVFIGIPEGATFRASIGGYCYQEETLPASELEYSVPVPSLVKVTFDLWPYQMFVVDIEVVA